MRLFCASVIPSSYRTVIICKQKCHSYTRSPPWLRLHLYNGNIGTCMASHRISICMSGLAGEDRRGAAKIKILVLCDCTPAWQGLFLAALVKRKGGAAATLPCMECWYGGGRLLPTAELFASGATDDANTLLAYALHICGSLVPRSLRPTPGFFVRTAISHHLIQPFFGCPHVCELPNFSICKYTPLEQSNSST